MRCQRDLELLGRDRDPSMGLSTKGTGRPCASLHKTGRLGPHTQEGLSEGDSQVSSSAEMWLLANSERSFLVSFTPFQPLQIRVRPPL